MSDEITRNLQIVKCRSSKHSEKRHPYRIVGGLGLIVHHKGFPVPKNNKIAKKLYSQFNDYAPKLPKDVRVRVSKALNSLSDFDLRDVDPELLLEDIFKEYK